MIYIEFTIDDCNNILQDITTNDIILTLHFKQRLHGRSLDISTKITKYLQQKT